MLYTYIIFLNDPTIILQSCFSCLLKGRITVGMVRGPFVCLSVLVLAGLDLFYSPKVYIIATG